MTYATARTIRLFFKNLWDAKTFALIILLPRRLGLISSLNRKNSGPRNHLLVESKFGAFFHFVASSATFSFVGTHRHSCTSEFSRISPTQWATNCEYLRLSEFNQLITVLESVQMTRLSMLKRCAERILFDNLVPRTLANSSSLGIEMYFSGATRAFDPINFVVFDS